MFFQIFAYLTEAVIVYMYIRHIYEPKKNKLISFITILVSYLMLFFIYRFIINIEFVNTIIITLTNIVIIYFCFKNDKKFFITFSFRYKLFFQINRKSETVTYDNKFRIILCWWRWR